VKLIKFVHALAVSQNSATESFELGTIKQQLCLMPRHHNDKYKENYEAGIRTSHLLIITTKTTTIIIILQKSKVQSVGIKAKSVALKPQIKCQMRNFSGMSFGQTVRGLIADQVEVRAIFLHDAFGT